MAGVDGSDGSVVALCWALDETRLRGATLDVVHSWHLPYTAYTEVSGAWACDLADPDGIAVPVYIHERHA